MFNKQILYSLFLVLLVPMVYGATFDVTKIADTNDGTCDSDCSLREAITAANSNGVTNTINVPAGEYTILIAINNDGNGDDDDNADGDFDIDSDLTITGAGSGSTFIQGGTNDTNGLDRVFHILSVNTVTIEKVTVRYGRSNSVNTIVGVYGGGISNFGISLTLQDCSISQNTAYKGNGGGIFNNTGMLTITNCTIGNNIAHHDNTGNISGFYGKSGKGGGIQTGGDININNSTIYGNRAGHTTTSDGTGGIRNITSTVTIKNTIIIGNVNDKNNDTSNSTDSDCGGGTNITSAGYNIVGTGTKCPHDQTGDIDFSSGTIADVINTTLNDSDGTFHLVEDITNPAFNPDDDPNDDTDDITCETNNDQVGTTDRANRGEFCDIGAYEIPVPINPTALAATPSLPPEIALSWTDNSDGVYDETNFRIERSINGANSWDKIAYPTVDTTSYNDTTVSCIDAYDYRIYAHNTHGDSYYDEITNIAVTCSGAVPNVAPTVLIATVISDTQINLSWTETSTNENGFKIERSPNGADSWVEVGSVGADVTDYPDTGLTCNTSYDYRVRAYNNGGYSGYTSTTNITTNACPLNFTVTTSTTGTGSGTVTGDGSYPSGDTVNLTTNSSSDSQFTSWSTGCSGSFTITSDITCTATFTKNSITPPTPPTTPTPQPPSPPPLPPTTNFFITFSGSGSGTVTSSPKGINCKTEDEECYYAFDTATKITLSYVADNGSEFEKWGGKATCQDGEIYLVSSTLCTAKFELLPLDLTVQFTGEGTVTSNPTGINCNKNCTETFKGNTEITLTPEPKLGWIFDKWEGACDSEGKVNLNTNKSCKAVFVIGEPLELHVLKTGKGYVSSNPPGIDCGEDCVEEYDNGVTISLTAVPDDGWVFEGWRGHCEETQTAIITESDRYCRAVFTIIPDAVIPPDETVPEDVSTQAKLTVTKFGQGTITTEGIQCGEVCQKDDYALNSQLNLTAIPADGWEFWGWERDCDINGNVVLNENKTCQATFGQPGVPLYLTVVKYGEGRIISQPAGIDCDIECEQSEHEFPGGTPVQLTAIPDSGWQLQGWRGHCDDTGRVTILHDYTTCRAFFTEDPDSIPTYGEQSDAPVHGGQLASVTLTYPDGSTKIQLTATPEADDYAFVGWDGDDCEGNTETIIVKVGAKCEPIFALDSDQDGTADMIENAAPNDGDGNNDGIPDSQQNNVISLPTASGLYLTTAVNEDCKVNSVRLDSDTTTFDLNCAEATVTNYHHGINELEPTKVSGYVITNPSYLNGKSLVTEKFTMTVDEFGKGIHINSIFPGKVQLSSSSYVARETDQTAKITVLRKNGCDGQITVDYNTQSDTATANVDYLLKYGSLTWEDNDCSRKSFNITIFDDLDEEDTEIIQINLLSSEVTEPFSADLTIVDDDSLVVDSDETSEQDITFEPENIISTNGEQIIYLTVGQSKVFTVQEAMTFVKQLPDLQLVLVSNLKSFSNEDGELTLTGLSVGQTELTVSNRDYSKEVTVKIIVTTGAEEINYIIQPTQPISPSTQPIAKCDKPNAMAINSAGLYVNSDSCFISTLNNIKQSSVKRKISQAKQVRIIAQIYIDPQDIGKIAEILLVARYTDPQDKTVLYNRGNKIWQVWKEQFDSLLTAQNHPLLPEIVNIFVFEGKLSLAGEFTVFVGYRLENGTIIFNGLEPLNFIVEGE